MAASTHPSLEYVLVAGIAAGGAYLATPIARVHRRGVDGDRAPARP